MSSNNIETRTRILDAAWKLLETGQGSGVRMSDIAKTAGISRQAVYLHFPTRAELLIATTRHLDAVKDVDARLMASRNAATGLERLEAFIEAWGNYIPEIHGVAKALLAMKDTDEAASLHAKVDLLSAKLDLLTNALTEQGLIKPATARKKPAAKRKPAAATAKKTKAKPAASSRAKPAKRKV